GGRAAWVAGGARPRRVGVLRHAGGWGGGGPASGSAPRRDRRVAVIEPHRRVQTAPTRGLRRAARVRLDRDARGDRPHVRTQFPGYPSRPTLHGARVRIPFDTSVA